MTPYQNAYNLPNMRNDPTGAQVPMAHEVVDLEKVAHYEEERERNLMYSQYATRAYQGKLQEMVDANNDVEEQNYDNMNADAAEAMVNELSGNNNAYAGFWAGYFASGNSFAQARDEYRTVSNGGNNGVYTYLDEDGTVTLQSSGNNHSSLAIQGDTGYTFFDGPFDDVGVQKQGVINIQRTWETNKSTISTFSTGDGSVNGYILERPGPSTTVSGLKLRVPAGSYNLMKSNGTATDKRIHAEWKLYNNDVSQLRNILFHLGNYPDDSDGCLLVGFTRDINSVGTSKNGANSKAAVDALNGYINSFNGNVVVNIFDKPKL